MANKKHIITESVSTEIIYELDGMSLDKLAEWAETEKASHPDHFDLKFEITYEDYYEGSGTDRNLNVIGKRWETDKEQAKRLTREEKERVKKAKEKAEEEAHEKELFEKLKKKYG